ncbi:type IV pilin protein [Sphingobacterium hotanense]|uniref:type IV pilin protein n=1 Tax=Sphingobacterium hotanense TaxID=649196 RepID=UPI0021A901A6|nr:type II secretion system protein [Sphingobacterium hotanense]MCT1526454.1 type II secretion system GspH family protein [Sphingobacterium hotanense]
MKKILRLKAEAYTLTEILVVLVIIGVLILLALPNLMPLITKTKSTEAKMQLQHLQTLQKSYFYEKSNYTKDLKELGFLAEKLVTEGTDGKANYKIEVIQADNKGFIARATSVVDFDGDGIYNVWEIDQNKNLKEITAD